MIPLDPQPTNFTISRVTMMELDNIHVEVDEPATKRRRVDDPIKDLPPSNGADRVRGIAPIKAE